MQRTQIDFLNHGILPFVGRDSEIGRILAFWRDTALAPGLRTLLLLGEAGIGKSRLVEEAGRAIALNGGAVVHLKLFPDATLSLPPLLARALTRSAAAQQLLKSLPDDSLSSVCSALVRICGLRPTLLAIEDIHLLSGDALADFHALLERLADEPLSLLCAARPVEIPARSVVERYLIGEVELEGLPKENIGELCQAVFGEPITPELVEILRDKTLGNALALRSALRAGVKSGAVSVSAPSGRTAAVRVDQARFVQELERNVRLLSEGMVAHLSEREKRAAGRLACLGEVFAPETAEAALRSGGMESAEGLIEGLTFRGIIHSATTTPATLPGPNARSQPLAFTHTLLHRYFIEVAQVDPDMLVLALSPDLPLYSLLPFTLLVEHGTSVCSEPHLIQSAITRALLVAAGLDRTPDWQHARTVWACASALFERIEPMLTEEERTELQIHLITNRLIIDRRNPDDEYARLIYQLIDLTEAPATEHLAELRLSALIFLRRHLKRHDPRQSSQVWDQVEEIIGRYPALRFSSHYVAHLRESVRAANLMHSIAGRRLVEARVKQLLDDDEVPDHVRRNAWRSISPYLLTLIETEQELEERLQMLTDLEAEIPAPRPELRMWKIALFYEIGRYDAVLDAIEEAMPELTDEGLIFETSSCTMLAISVRILLGEDREATTRELLATIAATGEAFKPTLNSICASQNAIAGFMLNDPAWLHDLLARLPHNPRIFPPEQHVLMALFEGAPARALPLLEPDDPVAAPFRSMIEAVLAPDDASLARARECAAPLLARPILVTGDILIRYAAIDLLAAAGSAHDLATAITRALTEILDWLAKRELPALMGAMLDRYGAYLGEKRVKGERERIAAIASRARPANSHEAIGRKVRVSLLGTINVALPDAEPTRVRGAQLCALLGLMAADNILAKPLTQSELMAIAFGTERDPDSLRKSMNFAVFRLRELLGSTEAIVTGGETPSLNLDLVEVDLIEAHRHLRAAADSMREGMLMRACPELLAALDISAGHVPFPTLYDEFFEAAREDFETELRLVVIRISRALAREGDLDAAESILSRAFSAMPDDEELAELLRETLLAQGKRAEAQRIGLRVTDVVAD